MLLIKTFIDKSKIHGIGLFANEFIQKGKIIAKINKLDIKVPLVKVKEDYVELFNFYSSLWGGVYQTYFDDMKFMNHSESNNCLDIENGMTIAIKDINKGDELTCDYRLICELWK